MSDLYEECKAFVENNLKYASHWHQGNKYTEGKFNPLYRALLGEIERHQRDRSFAEEYCITCHDEHGCEEPFPCQPLSAIAKELGIGQ